MSVETAASHEVFLSYSSKDKKWADAACAVLESRRIRCWIAPRDITPGVEWGAALIEGIDACKVMVLIFSGHANDSPQVRREVERVISKGRPVLPFRIENVSPAGAMEYALNNTHWLDGFSPPVERHLDILANSVERLLDRGRSRDHDWTIGDPPPPPRARTGRLMAFLVGCIVLGVVIVAGLAFAMSGSKATVPSVAEGKPATVVALTDEQRLQGNWEVVSFRRPRGHTISPEELAKSKEFWRIRGGNWMDNKMTDSGMQNSTGTIALRPASPWNQFDVGAKGPDDQDFVLAGIYKFEGDRLKVSYRPGRGADATPNRPGSFEINEGFFLEFKKSTGPGRGPRAASKKAE